jgi:hypothetical protein
VKLSLAPITMTLIAFSLLLVLNPGVVKSATSCAELKQARSEKFQEHAGTLTAIGRVRATLSNMNTDDPAVINRELERTTRAVKSWREKMGYMNKGAQEPFAPITAALNDALELWRSKKAHLESGGMIDVSGGAIYRANISKLLSRLQLTEKRLAEEIDKLDAEIKKCSSPKPTGEVSKASPWSGVWTDGAGGTYHLSGGQGSLSYTLQEEGGGGEGRCTLSGNVATCKWTEHTSETHTSDGGADVRSVRERTGHGTMTLTGTTIRVHMVDDAVSLNPPCPILDCGPPRPGSVRDFGLVRK